MVQTVMNLYFHQYRLLTENFVLVQLIITLLFRIFHVILPEMEILGIKSAHKSISIEDSCERNYEHTNIPEASPQA